MARVMRRIGGTYASRPRRVILRKPERSERRPKDRSRAKAVELPRGKAILRRSAPQDDEPRQSKRALTIDDADIPVLDGDDVRRPRWQRDSRNRRDARNSRHDLEVDLRSDRDRQTDDRTAVRHSPVAHCP